MNPNDKDRATVVRWTYENTLEEAVIDAKCGVGFDEAFAREQAKKTPGRSDPWRITITVERMPNEETK